MKVKQKELTKDYNSDERLAARRQLKAKQPLLELQAELARESRSSDSPGINDKLPRSLH